MILGREFGEIGVSCLDPKHIINKYDGNYYTVNCRRCPACLETRRKKIISRLETLRANSAACFFFTLTYDDYYLPLAHFSDDALSCNVTSYSALHRKKIVTPYDIAPQMDVIDKLILSRGAYSTTGVSYGPYNFGVLLKSELQKFFKRFRKLFNHAFPSQNCHFKYFAIGEYGVETYRPHFHGLIYLDFAVPSPELFMLICNAWKYGRIDFQPVTSSAASYCASYLNASTPLPAFLRIRQFAPFQVCSNGSFFEMWDCQVKEFFKKEFFNVPILHLTEVSGKSVLRPYSRSTRLQFFPVMPGFHQLDINTLRKRYAIFKNAAEAQGTDDPTFRVNYTFFDYVLEDDIPFSMLYSLSVANDSKNKKCWEHMDPYKYRQLYVSRRVYLLSKQYGIDFDKYVDTIIGYYKGYDVDHYSVGEHVYDVRHYSGRPTSELPSSSFCLALLRSQYSTMEHNVSSLEDLKLYYNYYNNSSSEGLYKFGDVFFNIITDDDCFSFYDLLNLSVDDNLNYIRSLSCLQSGLVVKHKERNSYWNLQNKKCFI